MVVSTASPLPVCVRARNPVYDMKFTWLKSYMPRSLFGRSLLMILFPVVVLQLVVGTVFIQRHFAQVTAQMASSIALELNYAAGLVEDMNSVEEARAVLLSLEKPFNIQFHLRLGERVVPETILHFYDVPGWTLLASLEDDINRPMAIDLKTSTTFAVIRIQTNRGVLVTVVPRARVNAQNPHQLLVLMLFTAIVLTVISALFLRNQIRPIRTLAEASEAFGKGRVEEYQPAGATEVRRAGVSFLAMRKRLERHIEQRTQMLSSVSHDLRTPLTRLKLSLEMMEEQGETREMQQDVEEMEKMLEAFLSFARGDTTEEMERVNALEFVDKIVSNCRRSGSDISYNFNMETPESPMVEMYAGSVARAITNLLENAMRYGDKVSVNGRLSEQHLRIIVEDDGSGIAAEDRKNALRPFVRLDEARTQDGRGGVGLGLAIVADVARSHGGTVELSRSVAFGGLKVSFTIPR